jgi:bifunctional UDP-N-acetylglucosamine pyrophosphorylase/glucosamine-1-phosphate N-acetyltransferase
MQAVIMAAGKSTRTYPLTLTRPKALLPVANKPILERQLDALDGLVDTVVIVVGYRQEMIRAAFGNSYGGMRLEYVEQEEQLGTGHAILQCARVIDGPFLAINGDDLYGDRDLAQLAAQERPTALVRTMADPRPFGAYEVDADRRVRRLVEKSANPPSNLVNIGAYKFYPQVFQILETLERSERGEVEITGAIQRLAEGDGFHVLEAQQFWLPIVYPWHLLDANSFWIDTYLRAENLGEISPAAHVNGLLYLGRGSVIRPGVVIDGPVCIGENCEVGPNCWLRPGATLGDGCKVGQASEIKNSILFEGAKAPHHNYVGDSILGAGVNLGCGTVTANLRHDGRNVHSLVKDVLVDTGRRKLGAIIGDGAHTGIHTSIYPGRKLWPGAGTHPGQAIHYDIILPESETD